MFVSRFLQTFALGGKEEEVAISLRLLKDTAKALRTSVVDDVHLSLRIADVLESLIKAINNQFVRLPPGSLSTPDQAKRTATLSEQQTHFASDDGQSDAKGFNPSDQYDDTHGPLAGISRTYNSPHDSNISIMPPIGNNYPYNNNNFVNTFTQSPTQQPPFYQNEVDTMPPFPSDWLTLDLQPLLGSDGLGSGGGGGGGDNNNPWLSAFAPETHNNIEVLSKLVNDGGAGGMYRGGDFGDDGMGF